MIAWIEKLGKFGLHFTLRIGISGMFLFKTIFQRPRFLSLIPLILEQLYFIGVLSLFIIIISSLFIGMVLELPGYNILQQFGSIYHTGRLQLVRLSVIKELGPVIAAILFAGRAGTVLTAEISSMQKSEQIFSMEMMAVNPLWRVVAPRFWAGVIAMPILTAIFYVMSIFGASLISVGWLGIEASQFWSSLGSAIDFRLDVVNGLIKGLGFGFAVTWIAVYQGYYNIVNREGICKATTKTFVYGSLAVIILDFILTSFMLGVM